MQWPNENALSMMIGCELRSLSLGSNRSVAYYKLCQQSFNVSNMGRSALNSHAKGKKHKEKEDSIKSLPITFFRQETVDKPSTSK